MDVSGKIVLITGSTDGVGKLVARQFAAAGAEVLLHGRSADKGAAVVDEIRAATDSRELGYFRADLASLEEVRDLAQRIAAKHDRLDILINNAGIGFGPRDRMRRETSREGHELRFAVNYLSHFLLTLKLLPVIRRSANARIVNVASLGQYPIDFADVMLSEAYDGTRAYRQSKLAQVMFTIDLAARLEASGITVNSLHPATFMNTRMVLESIGHATSTVEEGAVAILHVATSPALRSTTGLFFDGKRPARANPQAYDAIARRQLWGLSLELTGLTGEPIPEPR